MGKEEVTSGRHEEGVGGEERARKRREEDERVRVREDEAERGVARGEDEKCRRKKTKRKGKKRRRKRQIQKTNEWDGSPHCIFSICFRQYGHGAVLQYFLGGNCPKRKGPVP